MELEFTKDIVMSAGMAAIVGKIVWDWLKGGSAGSPAKKDTTPSNGNGNGKIPPNLAELLKEHRCGAHENMSSDLTKIIILQQGANEKIDTMTRTIDKNFDETFARLRGVEDRVGSVEGECKLLNERTHR